jgi:hypothetical protein
MAVVECLVRRVGRNVELSLVQLLMPGKSTLSACRLRKDLGRIETFRF